MTEHICHPAPLRKGDTIGIIAPAGQIVDRERFERGIAILHEMGFATRFPREMWPGTGFLADTDTLRAREFHRILADGEISAVMAARGGYGCIRLLEHLDMTSTRQYPKALIGFSDISILLDQAVRKAGLICFHGPVVTSLPDCSHDALARLQSCLAGNWQRAIVPKSLEILRDDSPGRQATGQLIGGNLSTLITLLGTPYDSSWRDRIVLLEDVGEPLYRVDRMLSQLALSGKLQEVSGLLLGDFSYDNDQDYLDKIRYTEYIWRRVLDLTAGSSAPVWGNIPAGHCSENLTLPLGAQAVMDSGRGELRFY